ncbi:MAG TPA: glycoside hydrolase family 127 protein, partial [Candidatus Parabacteroides intestinavium]|nr:glycoside hydrolase family 127 protein [Candidatus Parabacteroides intestinavium]
LESNGDHHRQAWYGCACCPSQISRFLPSIGNYIYGISKDALWVNLYIGNTTDVTIDNTEVTLHQETNYPWDGVVKFTVSSSQPVDKNLKIRIPDWCKEYTLAVNGEKVNHNIEKGYAVISSWKSGDVITLNMDMPVEKVSADPRVKQDVGKRAIQRGPLVYCLEEIDNQKDFSQLIINKDTRFEVLDKPELLDGVKMIEATTGGQHMYLIPYYAWDNRQAGKMKVWIDYQE